MANVFIEESTLTAIGNAIRSKTGSADLILPADMPMHIEGITGGGSGESSDVLKYVTFMSEDGTTELFKMPVIKGDNCKDPITHGDIAKPTKESSNTEHFSYSGWSDTSGGSANADVLKNVTEDKVVYASYTASTRYYTVNFYDDTKLMHTAQVTYGEDASNSFVPEKDGYRLVEWQPSVSNITEDTNTYAVWVESLRLNDASWETIAEKSADGTARDLWKVGDEKIIELTDGSQVPVVIVGFNHDELADGSGKAGITFAFAKAAHEKYNLFAMGVAWADGTKYGETVTPQYNVQTYMNENLPVELVNNIKTVKKKWYEPKTSTTYETNNDTLWLFSACEIGLNAYSDILSSEGEPYEYFTAGKNKLNTAYEELIRHNLEGTAVQWYLRTTNKYVYNQGGIFKISVTNKGELKIYTSVDKDTWYVPGFCI